MSSDTIEVAKRDALGSLASRRLRSTGQVPAVLYGHGEENIHLSVKSDAISRILHRGTKVLSLTGEVAETALIRDVQWDAFGVDVLHVDFTRVSQSETVEVTLPVELHGEAPGASEGGQLSFVAHDLTISCPAARIPEQIVINIGGLHLGEAILAGDVELPEGATMVTNASDVVAQVVKQVEESEEEAVAAEGEPEVISKGKGEEEEDS